VILGSKVIIILKNGLIYGKKYILDLTAFKIIKEER
jgi:hypothetical protein